MACPKLFFIFLILRAGFGRGEDEGREECSLQGLDARSLGTVRTLAEATLIEKHSTNLIALLGDPCDQVKRGMVTMGFKMRNTAEPLADFTTKLLEALPADKVAEAWSLLPSEPRTWTLKAFINSLPCRVAPGASKCDEESTNSILGKFEEARFQYTQRRVADAGMDPFPADEERPEEGAMEKYVKRLGIAEEASKWVLSEFQTTENQTIVEPDWFLGIANRCRGLAHSKVPDVGDAEKSADLADLDAATRVALWAWHYKDCHRSQVLIAYGEHHNRKEDVASEKREEL